MRHMKMNSVLKLSAVFIAAAVLAGCSKKTPEPAPAPAPPPPPTASTAAPEKTPAPAPAPAPSASTDTTAVVPPKPETAVLPVPTPDTVSTSAAEAQEAAQQNAEAAKQIAQYETVYRSSTDFSSRIDAIYRISDAGTAGSVTALGRLFAYETDPELKTEILDALSDVDGQDDSKIVILSAAVSPDQAKDVRQSAIDALSNVEPKKALPILQALISDSDTDISDSAKDAIEQVKANMENAQ